MATAKQLLQYVANKGTEQDAAKLLSRSGITFRDSAVKYTVNSDGALVNPEGQVVTLSAGQITGFEVPESEAEEPEDQDTEDQGSGTEEVESLTPPSGIPAK